MGILPYPMTGSEDKGEGMKLGAGGVIMSKLGNETAKYVLVVLLQFVLFYCPRRLMRAVVAGQNWGVRRGSYCTSSHSLTRLLCADMGVVFSLLFQ